MMQPTSAGDTGVLTRPMRSDARRNYDRLLVAAMAVFAEHGADAPLDDIAKRAGVGSATLYRHFPTRQILVEAIFRDRVEALCARARELLDDPSPVAALEAWLVAVVEHSTTYRGLAAAQIAMQINDNPTSSAARHAEIRQAGRALLVRAQESSAVRADLDITDVLKLVNAIAWVIEQAPSQPDQAQRLLSIVNKGIRSRG